LPPGWIYVMFELVKRADLVCRVTTIA